MFKKFITLVMAVSFFTTTAFAGSNNGLKAAFDELNYSLNVEWDQKDKDFYATQMKNFSDKVRELQSKGLTSAQIMDFIKAEVKDANVARDIEAAFNMISINKMSSAEASKYLAETVKRSYSAGASWNGNVAYTILIAAVVVLFVVAAATGGVTYVGGGCRNTYVCDEYYDYYYGYWVEDCYYTCY